MKTLYPISLAENAIKFKLKPKWKRKLNKNEVEMEWEGKYIWYKIWEVQIKIESRHDTLWQGEKTKVHLVHFSIPTMHKPVLTEQKSQFNTH